MRQIIALVFVVALMGSLKVSAQIISACPLPPDPQNCMLHHSWDDFPSGMPRGTICCTPPGGAFFNTYCSTPTNLCGPTSSDCPTCPKGTPSAPPSSSCQGGGGSSSGGPIDVGTGNTSITGADVSIPGLGGGLRLLRTWSSKLPADQVGFAGMFGGAWRSNYEDRLLFNNPDNRLKYAEANGGVSSFGFSGYASSGHYQYKSTTGDPNTVITDDISSLTISFQTGEKRTYDSTSGRLLSFSDRNGNLTQLTYDASNRLTTVTDPASRHLYFNYNGSSTLVSTVTSDIGISLSYGYDAQGNLINVTKPDSTTVTFVYDTNSRITSVLDTNGKVLESHTYDAAGRGLTSSRANGVDAISVTYQQ